MGSVKISQYTGDLSADSGSFNHITVTGNIQGGLPSGLISSSTQIDTDFFDIDGLVSSSTQIDDLGFLKVSGDSVISSSAQVVSSLPAGTISGSEQVDYRFISNVVSGIVSSSDQILPITTSSITDFNTEVSRSAADAGFGSGGGGFTPSLSTDITARNITASGDISASGNIIANSFTGTVITATTASYVAASNIDGTIDISDQTNLVGGTNLTLSGDTLNLDTNISLTDITASGDIVPSGISGNIKYKLSASGDIIATTLKIKDFFFGSFDADTLRITYDGNYILEIANDADIDEVKIFKPTEIVGNVSASGLISAYGSSSLHGLPTTEPNVTGALWISGSSEAHPNSGYLMVFNP